MLVRNEERDIATSDITDLNILQSSERHTDVTTYDLSDLWAINLSQATRTLKKTTEKFLHSAVIPMDRRYLMDRVFTRKTLQGKWSCDTMNKR